MLVDRFREGIFCGSRLDGLKGKVTVFLVACDTKRPSQKFIALIAIGFSIQGLNLQCIRTCLYIST